MPGQDRDIELVHRIAAGDENALQALYTAYGQRLYAYALRLTCDSALAEDVVQDSLVAAWQGAGRFRGDGRVLAWLLSIVHHKGLSTLRNRPLPLPGEDEIGEPTLEEPSLDEQVVSSEQVRLLREGLKDLSLEHRTVLELVFYQGLSLNEAAGVLGCPVGTVKSRLSYAKTSLRGVLNRQGLGVEEIS